MYRECANLLLFSDLGAENLLIPMGEVFRDWENGTCEKYVLVGRIHALIKRLLDLSTLYGFNDNLWHNYLTFLLITNENSFTLTCERSKVHEGSVTGFAESDFAVFKRLFDFDFAPIEADLGINCFSVVTHYHAVPKRAGLYYRQISAIVRALSQKLERAQTAHEMFEALTAHYHEHGTGMFGLNRAFRIDEDHGDVRFTAINNIDSVTLDHLIGYEPQKQLLRENIEAFLDGRGYNNTLLYGDAGTGKSTSVKAVLNEYSARGLRMIEIYKYQFPLLGKVIARVKNRNYRFIIFIDDLSFEENEVEYKFLKAVIEGGVETRPDNVMICATSNRRHLIRETWNDRSDMQHDNDVHRSDTLEEKLSLAARFGCAINYSNPNRAQFNAIVKGLAEQYGLKDVDEALLLREANKWELHHGGVSGRTAQQFINYFSGLLAAEKDDAKDANYGNT